MLHLYYFPLFVHIYIYTFICSESCRHRNGSKILFFCVRAAVLTINCKHYITWYRKNSIDFELSRSSSNFPYSNHIARYALELKFPFISLNIFTYGWIRITIIEVKDTAEGKNAILFMDYANFTAAARFN